MKDKIIASLGQRYKGRGLSNTYKTSLADFIGPQITTEEEIEEKITELDSMIQAAIKEADRRGSKQKETEKSDEEEKKDPKKEPEGETPTEKALRLLMEKLEAQDAKLTAMENEKKSASTLESFKKLIGEDVPPTFYKGRIIPEDAEAMKTFAEELQNDWKEIAPANPKPWIGTPLNKQSTATKDEVKAISKQIVQGIIPKGQLKN